MADPTEDLLPQAPVSVSVALELSDPLLVLIADYQRFYGVDRPDEARNREFFSRFLGAGEEGVLLEARGEEQLVGFACVYWTLSSVRAQPIALMNDLFVAESARGVGTGRALIEAAAEQSAARGLGVLRWWTALGNRRAQRIYESTGARRSAWFEYELELEPR